MRNGWKLGHFGDYVTMLSGGTPSKAKSSYWTGDIPWVSCKDMKTERLFDAEDHLSHEGVENGTRMVTTGMVLIVVRGMILAKEFPVAIAKKPLAFNQDLKALKCAPCLDDQFLFYWLKSKTYDILGIADEAAHGTKRLQTDRLQNLEIAIPPQNTQRAIVAVLSAYDDLIENNTRRIKILEDMAQMLYREWFVNFRFPGHEKVRMAESELGPIPEGWLIRSIGDFGAVVTGKTPSTDRPDFYGPDVPFIKTPDMHGNLFCVAVTDYLSTAGAESQKNKTVPANSIMVNCIGALAGSVSITTRPAQTNQQINSVVLNNKTDREFLYLSLTALREVLRQIGSNGATMINVNKSKFEGLLLVVPPADIGSKFHGLTFAMFEEVRNLQARIINLRTTRDLLLPKLISGEIPVEASDEAAAELMEQTA